MKNERIRQIEKRCDNALTILATMAVASAAIWSCGVVIPASINLSAAITTICSAIALWGIIFIRIGLSVLEMKNKEMK